MQLIERDSELAALRHHFSEAANNKGQVLVIAAPGATGANPQPAPDGGGSAPSGASTGPSQPPLAVAGFDPATGLVTGPDGLPLEFGGTGGQYRLAGDQSWKELLLAGLSP